MGRRSPLQRPRPDPRASPPLSTSRFLRPTTDASHQHGAARAGSPPMSPQRAMAHSGTPDHHQTCSAERSWEKLLCFLLVALNPQRDQRKSWGQICGNTETSLCAQRALTLIPWLYLNTKEMMFWKTCPSYQEVLLGKWPTPRQGLQPLPFRGFATLESECPSYQRPQRPHSPRTQSPHRVTTSNRVGLPKEHRRLLNQSIQRLGHGQNQRSRNLHFFTSKSRGLAGMRMSPANHPALQNQPCAQVINTVHPLPGRARWGCIGQHETQGNGPAQWTKWLPAGREFHMATSLSPSCITPRQVPCLWAG